MIYPETRRIDTVEEHFGTSVADPYRWLEGDARRYPEIADWVRAQDTLARSHLSNLPGRDHFRDRLAALLDHARLTAPEKRGNQYFFTRNPGLENHAVLVVREGADGADRVLIDPNRWSEDRASALAEWAVSDNGRYVAYATHESGSDWRTIRVLDVENGNILPMRPAGRALPRSLGHWTAPVFSILVFQSRQQETPSKRRSPTTPSTSMH